MTRYLPLTWGLALLLAMNGPALALDCPPPQVHSQADVGTTLQAWALLTKPTPSGFGQRYAAEFLLSQIYHFPEGGSIHHRLDHLDLTHPYFEEARLSNGYFFGSTFRQGNFAKAYLCNANFQLVDFDSSSFVQANLSDANLRGSDFSNANVLNAIFEGADISSADFRTSTNLTQAQVDSACYRPEYGAPQLPGSLTPPPRCS